MLGRSPLCDVVLYGAGVGRRHAQIERGPSGQLILTDRSSAAGTYLNGRRIEGSVVLHDGDRLQLGTSGVLRVLWGGSRARRPNEARRKSWARITGRAEGVQERPCSEGPSSGGEEVCR
jgi:pSer/pThr/pTyr-binding forkhead associated (FHA) protein